MDLAEAIIKAFSSNAIFNIEAHLVCMIVIIIMLNRQHNSSDQAQAGLVWVRLLTVQFLYCFFKILNVLSYLNLLPDNSILHYMFFGINIICFFLMCLFFFAYQRLSWTGKSQIYGVRPLPRALINTGIFTAIGLIQIIDIELPVLCYAIMISDISMYINYTYSLVSIDPLTKIPNRNGLLRNLSERMRVGNLDNFYVFAVDIDSLGKINSKFGRTEGDRILIAVAGAFKKFRNQEHQCYVARYQGDLFIMAADINSDEELELFEEHIKNYVSNLTVSENLKYYLHVNIGRSKYEYLSKTETITGLIEEAEKNLLKVKEQRTVKDFWQK